MMILQKNGRFSSALEQTAFDKDVRDVIKNEFSHIVAAVPIISFL